MSKPGSSATNEALNRELAIAFLESDRNCSQLRAYAGDNLYTEGMTGDHMYVIKDGEVELFLVREEKRVVVATLGKGECFGMMPQLLHSRRTVNAVAKTYCEFFVIDSYQLQSQLDKVPPLVAKILNSMAQRITVADKVIATRVNYQPEYLVYAQLLHLIGLVDVGGRKSVAQAGTNAANQIVASPPLSQVVAFARNMLGHSDPHIRHVLSNLMSLHLITIEAEKGDTKYVTFNPVDIVTRVRKMAGNHRDHGKLDFEYIGVEEFATLVEADRSVLLNKLARGEFADDLFTFRKSEVMNLLNTKGRKYFVEKKIKKPEEFTEITDIEFADQRSIFDVLSHYDVYDLAKVYKVVTDEGARNKILSGLPKSKREEVVEESESFNNLDPIEAAQLGQHIIDKIKERMTKR